MNIRDLIDITSGGPGSGCHGENCGRPPGHRGEHSSLGKAAVKSVQSLKEFLGKEEIGATQTYLVTLEDGQRGVYKSQWSQDNDIIKDIPES